MQLRKTVTNINTLQRQLSQASASVQDDPYRLYEVKKYNDTIGYFVSPQLAQKLFDYLEELDMINDTKLIESINTSKREIKEGKGRKLEDILKELDN